MILRIILAATLMFPLGAAAQQPTPTPDVEAFTQTVIKLTGESLNWQTLAITRQRQIDELNKQLEAAKKTEKKD